MIAQNRLRFESTSWSSKVVVQYLFEAVLLLVPYDATAQIRSITCCSFQSHLPKDRRDTFEIQQAVSGSPESEIQRDGKSLERIPVYLDQHPYSAGIPFDFASPPHLCREESQE